ncbi:hypothetical protein [Pelagibius sp.]|uniref:hypothetical protein n=1 Tax=Pelagibius sp. TaxID=1931238 RepID=UPI003B5126D9
MRVLPLTNGKISQAYPLAQLSHPQLSLEAWTQFAALHLAPALPLERGILTAEDDQGTIYALLAYTIDPDLDHGRALIAREVIAAAPLHCTRSTAVAALVQATERLAREKRCMALKTHFGAGGEGHPERSLHAPLLAAGHAPDHVMLCKTLVGH